MSLNDCATPRSVCGDMLTSRERRAAFATMQTLGVIGGCNDLGMIAPRAGKGPNARALSPRGTTCGQAGTTERMQAVRSMQALGMHANFIELVSTRGKAPASVSNSRQESARSSESKQESQRRHYSSSPNASQRAVVQGGSDHSLNCIVSDIKAQASFGILAKEPRRMLPTSQQTSRLLGRSRSSDSQASASEVHETGWLQEEVDSNLRNTLMQHLDVDVSSSTQWNPASQLRSVGFKHAAATGGGVPEARAPLSSGKLRAGASPRSVCAPPTQARGARLWARAGSAEPGSARAPLGAVNTIGGLGSAAKLQQHHPYHLTSGRRRPAGTYGRGPAVEVDLSSIQQSVSVVKTLQNMTELTPVDSASNAVLTTLVQEKLDRIWEAVVNELDGKKTTAAFSRAGEELSVISTDPGSIGASPEMSSTPGSPLRF
mmetsp:Transcript_28828/g.66454  ORF Transcript_28828/g.66454 Transcript_28828/m.66454 type:complete len:431 (-) Transcript_28828:48-1340(-)